MTKVQIEQRRYKSSSALRARTTTELEVVKSRRIEVRNTMIDHRKCHANLMKAARFAVDVAGDPPSMDQLRAAVEMAEHQKELFTEDVELARQERQLRHDQHYYQFRAVDYDGPMGIGVVVGQGDTKAKAMAAAKCSG